MSDDNAHQTAPPDDGTPSHEDWRGHRPPVGALVLIGLAGLFVLHQFGFSFTDRWWTAFVLIPAGGALVGAARFYRGTGGWTPPAIGLSIVGVLLMGLWAKLFFGFGMWHLAAFHGHFFVPVILLVLGVALLVRRARWQR